MSNDLNIVKQTNSNKLTIATIPIGIPHEIVACNLPPKLKSRLAEMGLTPHTTVTVVKVAPLGDPLEVTVRGYSLCLRAETARQIYVVIADEQNS